MSQRGNQERNFFLKGPVINKNKNNIDIYILILLWAGTLKR